MKKIIAALSCAICLNAHGLDIPKPIPYPKLMCFEQDEKFKMEPFAVVVISSNLNEKRRAKGTTTAVYRGESTRAVYKDGDLPIAGIYPEQGDSLWYVVVPLSLFNGSAALTLHVSHDMTADMYDSFGVVHHSDLICTVAMEPPKPKEKAPEYTPS